MIADTAATVICVCGVGVNVNENEVVEEMVVMNMKVFFVEDSKNIKIACRTYPPHPAREGAEPELMDGYLKRYIRHHYEPVDLNLNDSLEFSCRRTRWRAIVAREARGRNSHLKADFTHR